MAEVILGEFLSYKPIVEAKVEIDYMFAFAEVGEDGESRGHALTKHGIRALGITRKIGIKDRVMGRGDAEVCIDGDWWGEATPARRRALLDHELHHLEVKLDEDGVVIRDDLKRPKLKLRKHDVEVGWFALVAGRHGSNSLEIEQAKMVMESYGQLFWPCIDSQEPLQLADIPESDDERTPAKRKRRAAK
jgi:Putative phage metallopeptidase